MGLSNEGDAYDMIPDVAINLGKDIVLISSSEKSKSTLVSFHFWKSGQNIMFRKNLKDNNFVQFFEDRGYYFMFRKQVKDKNFVHFFEGRAKLYHLQKYVKEH